ncbi:MAG TPA: alpha/beta hydrolase [Gemmatimonadales bacterium]|nr:alpha/beta hydrolase [Gemmatimonadales bacterium]
MKHHTIIGGGGTRLHVVEAGDPRGPSILFLHGCSQSWLTWDRQMRSGLARRYRLVAMDLRGHGSSERPLEAYDDSGLWAADLDAAIRELELDRPILCGWSYGPLVILDYIRHYGEERIGGIHFVGAVTNLGSEAAAAVLSAEFLALLPGLFSSDVGEGVRGLESLLRLCFVREPEASDLYTMLGFGVSVPPFVRQALLTRVVENDDLLPTIVKPVLITHGALDAVVRQEVVAQHRAGLPHAQVDIMPDAGHAAFWDDAAQFNRRLGAFREEVARSGGLHLAADGAA